MGKREAGGVVIALLGFTALTLAFKGTWENVWHALVTGSGVSSLPNVSGAGATASGGAATAATTTGAPAKTPGSGPVPMSGIHVNGL